MRKKEHLSVSRPNRVAEGREGSGGVALREY